MQVAVSINNCRISGPLLSAILENLAESPLWSRLRYDAALQQTTNPPVVEMQCQIFNAITADLTSATFNRMDSVDVKFGYFTSEILLSTEKLITALLRSVRSLLVNLEFRYPFVFSFYGRHLLYTNYNWLIKDIHELQRGSVTSPSASVLEQDANVIFVLTLSSMQKRILHEFNTLNIMKECDLSARRRTSCRKQMEKGDDDLPSASIKNKVVDFSILDVARVEETLRKNHSKELYS